MRVLFSNPVRPGSFIFNSSFQLISLLLDFIGGSKRSQFALWTVCLHISLSGSSNSLGTSFIFHVATGNSIAKFSVLVRVLFFLLLTAFSLLSFRPSQQPSWGPQGFHLHSPPGPSCCLMQKHAVESEARSCRALSAIIRTLDFTLSEKRNHCRMLNRSVKWSDLCFNRIPFNAHVDGGLTSKGVAKEIQVNWDDRLDLGVVRIYQILFTFST